MLDYTATLPKDCSKELVRRSAVLNSSLGVSRKAGRIPSGLISVWGLLVASKIHPDTY